MFERLVLEVSDADDYLDLTVLSILFTLISVILAYRVVPFQVDGGNFAGVMAVLFVSLAVAYPFVRHLIEQEDREAQKRWSEKKLLSRHADDMMLYLSFFVGTTLGFSIATFFVPDSFFSVQSSVLGAIRGPTGSMIANSFMYEIIVNNLGVFAVTFVLTFFVSSGIIFVLAWNASVLGVLIGELSGTVFHVPFLTVPYLPHGLLEVAGYIFAGIAGSLLSYEVEIVTFEGERGLDVSKTLLKDVVTIAAIGVLCILAGGVIEAL